MTLDEKMEFLEQEVRRLQHEVAHLSFELRTLQMMNRPTPPELPSDGSWQCGQCSMRIMPGQTLGYVCAQPRCPSGLGSPWC